MHLRPDSGGPSRRRQSASTAERFACRHDALAIKFQDMVDRGEVRDYADLARLGYVSRARITQIMNLLNLAPDIQEEILRLDASVENAALAERQIRSISKIVPWAIQRRAWRESRDG